MKFDPVFLGTMQAFIDGIFWDRGLFGTAKCDTNQELRQNNHYGIVSRFLFGREQSESN